MKPFNLNEALAGEPVKLRCEAKAYVKYVLDDEYNTVYPLRGFIEWDRIDGGLGFTQCSWTSNGRLDTSRETEMDIVGMWEEPKTKRYVNGVEVPEPVTEETWVDGEVYYRVNFTSTSYVSAKPFLRKYTSDINLVTRGMVFTTKEDARTMALALLNYKVEYKDG